VVNKDDRQIWLIRGPFAIFARMLKVTVNDKVHNVEFTSNDKCRGLLNGEEFTWSPVPLGKDVFHVLKDNKSFTLEVLAHDPSAKTFRIRVNGNTYSLKVNDRYDDLLRALGFESGGEGAIKEIKAPMPGLVLDILVKEGDLLAKGVPMMVLEAMKMENLLKSPMEAEVKKIHVKKGQVVEKNQILLSF
jgi:acetyl/propionyl-CoA carboxylase alpha subunit